jgi:glyoxylase-like metal-dependent hydrolase (beta-lactamase superfamily II)
MVQVSDESYVRGSHLNAFLPSSFPASSFNVRPHPYFTVAPLVTGYRTMMVNLYFVGSPLAKQAWVLVDAGLPGYSYEIRQRAAKLFGANNPPVAIILTHGHFDHVGSLPALLRRWSCPVYAHPHELPFLNEKREYPPPDPSVGGGIIARSSTLFPRANELPKPVLPLAIDGSVPGLPDWKWIPTPGHTPGHVSLWRPVDRLLISGDALISTRQESARAVWQQRAEVRPPPAYFTPDWRTAYDSIERLRGLGPDVLAPGHGVPLKGQAWRKELDDLIADFPGRGLPRQGQYVRSTWPQPVAG